MTDQNKKRKKTSQFTEIMKRLAKNKGAMVGLVIIVLMGIIALLSPYITPYPYDKTDFSNIFAPFSKEHIFGTDQLGRDILSRLMYGGRYSLQIGIYSVAMAVTAGTIIGSIIIRTIVTFVYYFGIVSEATMFFKAVIIAVIIVLQSEPVRNWSAKRSKAKAMAKGGALNV